MTKIITALTIAISILLIAAGVIIQMNKCNEPNNRKYAKTITGVSVGTLGVVTIYKFKKEILDILKSLFTENSVLIIPIVMSILMVATTSVIIDNKCADKKNKNYGIASIVIGSLASLLGILFIIDVF